MSQAQPANRQRRATQVAQPHKPRKPTDPTNPRAHTGSPIPRSQFAPSAWHAKLGNGTIADAVIDRIARKPRIIHIEGGRPRTGA